MRPTGAIVAGSHAMVMTPAQWRRSQYERVSPFTMIRRAAAGSLGSCGIAAVGTIGQRSTS